MKRLLLLLLAYLQLSAGVAQAELSAETLQRAQKELAGNCYEIFSVLKTDKSTSGNGYGALSGHHKVFVIGENGNVQRCFMNTTGYLFFGPLNFGLLIKRILAECNKAMPAGHSCEIYAKDDNIVYIPTEQKIVEAKKSYEAKDYPKAFNLLTSVSSRGVETIDKAIASDFEYMLGNTLVKIDKESNGFEAIKHFNKSWHYLNNPQAALEEANLRIATDQLSYNWEVIRLAYEHYFKNASAEAKLANQEAITNYKLTESYYQASLDNIRKNEEELAANEKAAVEQAKLDLQAAELAAKNAERDARKAEREAKRLAEAQKKEEAKLAKQAAEAIKTRHDKTCRSYGAAVGTQAYVMCRIELAKNEKSLPVVAQLNEADINSIQGSSKDKGDGSSDDVTCQKFGFKPSSTSYSQCRLQLDTAKRQLEVQQAQFNLQQEQYQSQKAEYDAKVARYKDQQDTEFWVGIAGMGFGMMEGKTPLDAYRQSLGLPPIAPAVPAFENYSITMPGGRTANCTYTTVTRSMNCQ